MTKRVVEHEIKLDEDRNILTGGKMLEIDKVLLEMKKTKEALQSRLLPTATNTMFGTRIIISFKQ